MSGFNKATSFILGLIVVLVFLFVFGSRINLSDKLIAFRNIKATPTPKVALITPTPNPSASSGSTTKKKGFFESLFARKTTPTPSASSGQAATQTTVKTSDGVVRGAITTGSNNSTNSVATRPQTIPQTGSPTILFPILVSALGSGLYLRKKN
ncbi:MAG: hypothetical protein WBC38_02020 [Microgenomates group bacterium]